MILTFNRMRCKLKPVPLVALTASDLPSQPQVAEETLRKYFKLAASWDAILLLDEMDVLSGKRSGTDFVRTALYLVSRVFLLLT